MSGKHSVLSLLLAHIRHLIIPCIVDLAFEARVVSSGSLEQLWSGLSLVLVNVSCCLSSLVSLVCPPSSPLFFPSLSPAACLRFSFSLLLSRFDGILVAVACGGEARMCTFVGPVFPVGTFP